MPLGFYTEEKVLEPDEAYVLSNSRRRGTMRALEAPGSVASVLNSILGRDDRSYSERRLVDVAEQVAAWENDKDLRSVTSDEKTRAYTAIYQDHAPVLEERGILEFDREDENTLVPGEEVGDYRKFLEERPSPESDFPGIERYLEDGVERLSADDGYRLLSSGRRQNVLRYIDENNVPVEISGLVDEITDVEETRQDTAIGGRKRTYIGLHQQDLPALDSYGVVDYSPDDGTVEDDIYFDLLASYVPR